jgi:hypothetical protein
MIIRFSRLVLKEKRANNGRSSLLPIKTEKGGSTFPAVVLLAVFLASFTFACPSYSGPCGNIVTYRIGQIDERFGISRSEFSRLVKKAADMWAVPFSEALFEETSNGRILIEMVYDHRQDATGKLAQIDRNVREDSKTYHQLKSSHDKLQKEHDLKKARWDRDSAEYRARLQRFREVNMASLQRGRVSEETSRLLQGERNALNAMYNDLQERRKELKEIAARTDELVSMMDGIAGRHQNTAADYRKERERLGDGFGKGVYQRWGKSITIYQYRDKDNLVQVIAHEFGHTLGIRHLNDRRALMYPWDTGKQIDKLAPADIAALKARCKK